MPAHRMGDEPRCAESEFKDDRHEWASLTSNTPHHAERCAKCRMWRFGTAKRSGIAWRYILDDGKEVDAGAAPADGERA